MQSLSESHGGSKVTKPIFSNSRKRYLNGCTQGGGGSYFPYILLNEIQTMFSQLAKRSARVLPADLCTDHAHDVKNHRSTVLREKQKHGSRRRDCFSLLYFGNSQIY